MAALSSCYTPKSPNTINSGVDFGHYDNPSTDDWSNGGGISSKNIAQAPTKFVEGSKDIPLAMGLNKISDDGLDFDSVAGSIVAVTYQSSQDLKEMQSFYSKTLPEMGWKHVKNKKSKDSLMKFKRDNEKLEIEFMNYNGDDLVKFFVETASH